MRTVIERCDGHTVARRVVQSSHHKRLETLNLEIHRRATIKTVSARQAMAVALTSVWRDSLGNAAHICPRTVLVTTEGQEDDSFERSVLQHTDLVFKGACFLHTDRQRRLEGGARAGASWEVCLVGEAAVADRQRFDKTGQLSGQRVSLEHHEHIQGRGYSQRSLGLPRQSG